jgi:polygalacturonase
VNTLDRLLVTLAAACLVQSAPCLAAVWDVTALGAIPSDASDDVAAIQQAIDAAVEGDTVSLPGCTFLVNRTLRAKSGVKVQGAATDLTILKFNNTHVYGRPGTFRVTLVDWDDQGRGAIKERWVTVKPVPH